MPTDKPLKPQPKNITAVLGMLEGGSFQHGATTELTDLCAAISEHHAVHSKAKGTFTTWSPLAATGSACASSAGPVAAQAQKAHRSMGPSGRIRMEIFIPCPFCRRA